MALSRPLGPDIWLEPEDFREIIHDYGTDVRWFKAFASAKNNPKTATITYNQPSGAEYGFTWEEQIETDADGRIYHRVYFDEMSLRLITASEGRLQVGDLEMYYMGDEMPVARMDKFQLINQPVYGRETLVRGSGASDAIAQSAVEQLLFVYAETTHYTVGTHCILENNAVKWLTGGPSAGVPYKCEFRYAPTFWFLGMGQVPSRQVETVVGRGGGLPCVGMISLKAPNAANV